jgi:23S rRNA pseudouridine1911/1915/1917 synthase
MLQPVLYEDAYILVYNKPAGMAVEKSKTNKNNVFEAFKAHTFVKYTSNSIFELAHRLDAPTSGVLLFAKKASALKHLNKQFEERQVKKGYLALIDQGLPAKNGVLENWLKKDFTAQKAIIFKNPGEERVLATLEYQFVQRAEGRNLVLVKPSTGRYHQIRAQLSKIGCPIIGDEKYGSTVPYLEGQICLHAHRLQFTHPVTDEQMNITAPVPENNFWEPFAKAIATI